jgi:phosphate starvation-inducible PhoH-like protein
VSTKARPLAITLAPLDNARLQNLCGALDENLRQIEAAFDVTISRRGQHCRISGEAAQSRLAGAALQHFYEQAAEALSIDEIQLGLIEITRNRNAHGRPPRDRPAPACRRRSARPHRASGGVSAPDPGP